MSKRHNKTPYAGAENDHHNLSTDACVRTILRYLERIKPLRQLTIATKVTDAVNERVWADKYGDELERANEH